MGYEITHVSPDNSYVNIGIPRTNVEHRHVAVSALIFLEESRPPRNPPSPPTTSKPSRSASPWRSILELE
jgi:hypothetical protein